MQLSRFVWRVRGLAAGIVLVLGVAVAPVDGAAPQSGELDPEVAAAFGLNDGTVVSIDMDRTPNVRVNVVVPIGGADYELDLSPFSVRADDFVFLVQVPGGAYEDRDPGPIRTLRGGIEGLPGALVVGSMFEEGLSARIEFPDGDVFWIEPLASQLPHADRDLFVIYNEQDGEGGGGVCGTDLGFLPEVQDEPDDPQTQSGLQIAQLACDADVEYYVRHGSNEDTVRDRIESIINTVNIEYERDVNIIHVITTIIVRTSEPDPYSSTSPSVLLNQFRNHWNNNQGNVKRDQAHLFTNKNLNGNVIGIAYCIGCVCVRSRAYALSWAEFNGNNSCATDLVAHEMGHVWAGQHSGIPTGWTMYFSIQCANKFHSLSISRIGNHRDSRACLDKLGPLSLPFFEDWPTDDFDIFKWDEFTGVNIGGGPNPPSEPFAAQLDRTETLESREIDASGLNPAATLRFSWYLGESFTEDSDTFFADYLDSGNNWRNVLTDPGSGSQDHFDFYQFDLPDNAKPAGLKIRFRTEAGFNDIWYVDDILVSVSEVPAICIVHGDPAWDRNDSNTWTSFEDWAFSAYIDNKVESTDGINRDLGLTTFDVVFTTEPFGDNAGGPVTPGNITVFVTGGAAPGIANVTKNGNVLTLELDALLPLQEWTTFDFLVWNADGVKIVDIGNEGEGVDECSRLDVGTLPADVNNDGETQPLDLSRIIASGAGVCPCTMLPDAHIRSGSLEDYFDISRNGTYLPEDLSRVIAALAGSAPFTQNWNGVGMNSTQP